MFLNTDSKQHTTERYIQENLMYLLKLRRMILKDVDIWIEDMMGKLPPEVYQKVTVETLARLKETDPELAEWVHQNLS